MQKGIAFFSCVLTTLSIAPHVVVASAWDAVPVEGLPLTANSLPTPSAISPLFAPAVTFSLDSNIAGIWSDNGAWAVWRTAVTAADAISIGVHGVVRLPVGATLLISGADEVVRQTLIAKNSGALYSVSVPGSVLRMEMRVPVSQKNQASVAIDKMFVGVRKTSFTQPAPSAFEKFTQQSAQAAATTGPQNFSCYEDATNTNAGNATLMYQVFVRSGAGGNPAGYYQCSATLIENASHNGDMLALTAAHCGFSGPARGIDVDPASFTFYWNRQAPCNANATDGGLVDARSLPGPISTGATTVAVVLSRYPDSSDSRGYFETTSFGLGDTWLLRLNDSAPPSGSNAYFAGFDATVPTYSLPADRSLCSTNYRGEQYCANETYSGTPAGAFGVSHGGGDSKQYTVTSTPAAVSYAGWRQNETIGQTSPGSSGSGLFGTGQHIIGTATGGAGAETVYASLWYAWEGNQTAATRLRDALDPQATGLRVVDGRVAAVAPVLTLQTSRTSATVGDSAMLTWTATDSTTCQASDAWSGARATSGLESVLLSSPTAYTYTLTCTGAGGSDSRSVTVSVTSPPPPTPPPSTPPTGEQSGGGSGGGGSAEGLLPLLFAPWTAAVASEPEAMSRQRGLRFIVESGQVFSSQTHSETQLHATTSGGGRYITPSTQVTSTVTTTHEFWLKTPDERQVWVQLVNQNVPLAHGHRIAVVFAMRFKDKTMWPVALVNHDAVQTWRLKVADYLTHEISGPLKIWAIVVFLGLVLNWMHYGSLNTFLLAAAFLVYRGGCRLWRLYKAEKRIQQHLAKILVDVAANRSMAPMQLRDLPR